LKTNSPLEGDTDWEEVFRRLVLFAHHRLGVGADMALAEELASETISRFLLSDRGADAEVGSLNLTSDLGRAMETLLNERIAADAPSEAETSSPTQSVGFPQRAQSSDAPGPFSPISLLAQEIAGDRLMEGIVLLSLEGILDPSAQAVHLMSPIIEIYDARKRLLRAIARIRVASQPKV
jgi:hypothetical protein